MFIRKYHVVVHGNPIDPSTGTIATATLTHHRMAWYPLTPEELRRIEKEAAIANKWRLSIVVGIYPLNYYTLFSLHKELDGGGVDLIKPAGMPEWMRKAYNYIHNRKWRKS